MKLTSKGRYAVMALADIAKFEEALLSNLRASKNILDVIKEKAALDEDIEKSITDLITEVSKEFIKSE